VTEDLEVNNTSAVIPSLIRNCKNKQSSALLRFFGLRNQNDKIKSPLPPLLVCSRLTGLRARLSALTLRPQLASRFTKGGKKVAFTLAEVLVTLGIIGIVAAMTLPMLAKNYQFYVRQQQFKKAYAAMSIAVQKTQIDMGESVRCYYDAMNKGTPARNRADCKWFYSELVKNLQLSKTCKNKARAGKCLPKNGWRGGEIVYAERQGGEDKDAAIEYFNSQCNGFNTDYIDNKSAVYVVNSGFLFLPYGSSFPTFLVDVNGHGGPNKWGHDIFSFKFMKLDSHESVFKMLPSNMCQALEEGGYYTTDFFNYLYGQNAEL